MKTSGKLRTLVGLALIISSCSGEPPPEEKILRPVIYQAVGFQGGAIERSFSGTAETDKIIDLSFRTSGILTRFDLRVGQTVGKGQLLAQLDNVSARLAYEQAISSLNSAASQMNTAKLNFERVRSLYEKGSASLSDFENAKNSFRTAEASHESAQRSVDIQREQIGYASIFAPENGTIASVMAEIDENVNAGQSIAILNAGTQMEITLGLPENVINGVQDDMPVQVSFPSLPNQVFDGTVTEVSPSVDPNAATYPVRITVIEPSAEIRSGMTANVSFNFSTNVEEETALVVPAKAVGEDENGRFVFLIDESGASSTVNKHPVQVGALTPDGFVITDGLQAGQKIATAGLQTLLDGQEVRLQ